MLLKEVEEARGGFVSTQRDEAELDTSSASRVRQTAAHRRDAPSDWPDHTIAVLQTCSLV